MFKRIPDRNEIDRLLEEKERTEPRRFWRMTEDQLKQYKHMKDGVGVYIADINIRYNRWEIMGYPVYIDDHHKGEPELNILLPDGVRCIGDSDWVEFDPAKNRRINE